MSNDPSPAIRLKMISGRMSIFSILRKSSPGKESSSIQTRLGWAWCIETPRTTPNTTERKVAMRSRLFLAQRPVVLAHSEQRRSNNWRREASFSVISLWLSASLVSVDIAAVGELGRDRERKRKSGVSSWGKYQISRDRGRGSVIQVAQAHKKTLTVLLCV